MESLSIVNDPVRFDQAVHGGLDDLVIVPQASPITIYVKDGGTQSGKAVVVVTFAVELSPGKQVRVQATTTAALLETAGRAITGWRDGGHIH